MVETTEPICRAMDEKLADSLIFNTAGIESYVAENNPKFSHSKLNQAKAFSKINSEVNPYKTVYGLLPDRALANPAVKHQCVNGRFCYAQKAGILTNGLGIIRHIALLDENFKAAHNEMSVEKRSNNPDKDISDAKALLPVFRDFRAGHPSLAYSTSWAISLSIPMICILFCSVNMFFSRAVIPLNPRNSVCTSSADFNEFGVPLCPADKAPMRFHSICGGRIVQNALNSSVQNTKSS